MVRHGVTEKGGGLFEAIQQWSRVLGVLHIEVPISAVVVWIEVSDVRVFGFDEVRKDLGEVPSGVAEGRPFVVV